MMQMPSKKSLAGGSGIAAAIIAVILSVEGGYSNDPRDPGGETNHGITVGVARAAGYTGSMKEMDKDTATNIYVTNYINKPGYGDLITLSPAVGQKVVDAGVNAGTSRSSLWFQNALNALNRGTKSCPLIAADGKVGPGSIESYKCLAKTRGKVKACELVLKLVDAQQANHYMSLTNLPQYTVGWVDHRIGNVPLSRCAE